MADYLHLHDINSILNILKWQVKKQPRLIIWLRYD